MNKPELYTLLSEATASLATYYPQMQATIQEIGFGNVFGVVLMTRAAEPDPFTTEVYAQRVPYAAAERRQANLQGAVEQGFLTEAAPGEFRLTDKGRADIERVFDAAHKDLAQHAPLPEADLARLSGLLKKLVDATLAEPKPEHKRGLLASRWTDPGADAAWLVRVDQYATDLVAFRDDAHMAAWRAYDTPAEAWEALTVVWRDQAHTAAELVERLQGRGHTAEAYERALAGLAARGWVEADPATPGAFKVTEQGRVKREEAEAATDKLFFAAWRVLGEAERRDLIDLLTRLRDAARAAQAARQAAQEAAQAAQATA